MAVIIYCFTCSHPINHHTGSSGCFVGPCTCTHTPNVIANAAIDSALTYGLTK